MTARPTLLVTRPEPGASTFAARAAEAGFAPWIEPLATMEPLPGVAPSLDGVQAVLLTSANGARALAAAVSERSTPVLAVGRATAAAARSAGFRHVESADGDGPALAALARRRLDPKAGRALHVAGEARAFDVAEALSAVGFSAETLVIYRMRHADALTLECQAALAGPGFAYASFFSPQAARCFVRLIEAAGLRRMLVDTVAVAISQNAAAPLAVLDWQAVSVAEAPTAEAMLQTLSAYARGAVPTGGAEEAE